MEKIDLAKDPSQSKQHSGLGVRHFQAALTFFGLLVSYILRLNLSVAVVGMMTSEKYRVDLTPTTKALVLSSLFWGYGLLQVVSGSYGRRGYAVKLFALGNIVGGALTLYIPFAALNNGFIGIIILRFIIGLFQGNIYPNVGNVMANWAIPQEKEPIMCIVQSGAMFGNLIALSASGYIAYYYDWPSIFYISGLLGIIWGIIHYILGGDGPETHKAISDAEREYMRSCFRAGDKEVLKNKVAVPWKQIVTSGPVIALTVTMWATSWTLWTIISLTPTYINGVFGFDIADDGLLSSLPYLSCAITSLLLSFISGLLKRKTSIPQSFLQPFWNSIAMYGMAITLLVLAFAPANATLAILMLVTASTFYSANYLGHGANYLDLSPNFAGVIMSIANSTANTASILGPLISTYLIKNTSDPYQWRTVFVISAMISFLGNTVFLFWGSTKKQPWDENKQPESA